MIRPGSLDVLPDCLDGRRLEPERAPDPLTGMAWALLTILVLGPLAWGLYEAATAACPMWIIHGEQGRVIFAC
jgi:hypothetical protein